MPPHDLPFARASLAPDSAADTVGAHQCQFPVLGAALMLDTPASRASTRTPRASAVARAVVQARRPPVIWLHVQDCNASSEPMRRDEHEVPGPYEAALAHDPVAGARKPLELLRKVHSFHLCLACACHTNAVTRREPKTMRVP